jgi:hypothetical protein
MVTRFLSTSAILVSYLKLNSLQKYISLLSKQRASQTRIKQISNSSTQLSPRKLIPRFGPWLGLYWVLWVFPDSHHSIKALCTYRHDSALSQWTYRSDQLHVLQPRTLVWVSRLKRNLVRFRERHFSTILSFCSRGQVKLPACHSHNRWLSKWNGRIESNRMWS